MHPRTQNPQPPAQPQSHAPVRGFDRHWIRGYVWTGVLAGMLVTMPTSLAEIAIIPPALFFFPMCAVTWPLWRETLRRPAMLFLLAFTGWLALGLLWSNNPGLGIEEFGNLRFFAVAVLLTPAIRITTTGRRAIISAVCAGFLIGNLVQGLNAWALHSGGPGMFLFGRTPQRMSGWWDPAVAGTILTAALGLHLPAALMGKGRTRVIATLAVCITIIGLLMTGSRGGWIASLLLLSGSGCFAIVRAARLKTSRRATLLTIAALIVVAGTAGFVLRGPISQRTQQAINQISSAGAGDLSGDTGARIALKNKALDAFTHHPILGVGTGGFSGWIVQTSEPDKQAAGFDHAHDTVLHLAASNGLIGVGLLLGVFIAAARDGWRWTKQHGIGTYQAGPLFALVGLALTSPFDTLHVSASAAAITGMIVALCIAPPRSSAYEPIDIFANDRLRKASKT